MSPLGETLGQYSTPRLSVNRFSTTGLGRYREEIGFIPIAEAQKLPAIGRDIHYGVTKVAGHERRHEEPALRSVSIIWLRPSRREL